MTLFSVGHQPYPIFPSSCSAVNVPRWADSHGVSTENFKVNVLNVTVTWHWSWIWCSKLKCRWWCHNLAWKPGIPATEAKISFNKLKSYHFITQYLLKISSEYTTFWDKHIAQIQLFDPLLILYVCPLTKKWSVYNFNGRFIWTVRGRKTHFKVFRNWFAF